MMNKAKFDDYSFDLRPLSKAEGGGWLITWPDLPGCMSDGETPEEAIENGRDAFAAWMAVRQSDLEKPAPKASTGAGKPARFVLRTPKSMHARLVAKAQAEGVSLNTLLTLLALKRQGFLLLAYRCRSH
jgi:antitoxin HicB